MAPAAVEVREHVREAEFNLRRWRVALQRVTDLTGLTTSGLILVISAIISWSLGYYVAGKTLYLFAYGAGAVLFGSWMVGRRRLPITGDRSQVRARLREGETISVEVFLTTERRLSTLILEEHLPAMLGTSPRIPVAELNPGETASHAYQLSCWRRGVYTVGPLLARWSDPFGLTQRRIEICDKFELFVHPRAEPASDRPLTRMWEDPPIRPPISRPWPSGMEFYGLRPYQFGDDVRRIVWRASARSGELLVRESEQGVTDKFVILLDQDRQNHSSGLVSESFETAMRVAASLGVHHLREGYTVSIEGCEDRLCGPLRGSFAARMNLLDSLARAEPTSGSFSDLLERVLLRIPRDAEVMAITPLLTRKAAARLRLLIQQGISVIVIALMWLDESVDTLGVASELGLQVVEVGPNTNLTMAFRHEVGRGVRR